MLSYANGTTIDLLSLIPKCGSCLQEFDTFLHAPQILPCCHTFCLIINKPSVRTSTPSKICQIINKCFIQHVLFIHFLDANNGNLYCVIFQ
ncbi:unnamed protein product [Anisakis simplex]|uniref:Ovule protein n=1 Tax=Anisakis simplex TaxID=6269 RepID=A0A0M3J356_ANISI|nr:unnamed protein product [Anisakis simplex]